MKSLHDEITFAGDGELAATARLVVDTGVRLTRFVRRAVRASPPSALSLSAVRALSYVADHPELCVSDLAEHLIVGVPTASKLVDDLVSRDLVTRTPNERDRRRLVLRATPEGKEMLATAARPAQRRIAALLGTLNVGDQARVREGIAVLRKLLTPSDPEEPRG